MFAVLSTAKHQAAALVASAVFKSSRMPGPIVLASTMSPGIRLDLIEALNVKPAA